MATICRMRERYSCSNVLFEFKDVIWAAWGQLGPTGLPIDPRLQTVVGLDGVLNPDHSLCAPLRRVIDAVLDGRAIETMTHSDFLKIASRSSEWLGTPRLSISWSSAAYDVLANMRRSAGLPRQF